MPTNPQDILAFYEKFRGKLGWDSLEAMRIFVPQLFASRSFDGFHFFTSHEILCISHFADYSDREFEPQLSIGANSTKILRFEFTIHKPEHPIFRAFTERVICPIEHGLEQFDELFSRFRNAQKPK
jgi:hypothetical protein